MGKKVAILVADGFEQVETTKPREALNEAGSANENRVAKIRQNSGYESRG
jgi:putative intracellular protease/amidase